MNWQKKHGEVIKDFLGHLNNQTNQYVLKGGTALAQCYGLDRFSEDIDLDATQRNLEPVIEQFCESNGYTFNIKKDTPTAQRFSIHYDSNHKHLTIDASYRNKVISPDVIKNINGITVYDINTLYVQKCAAYAGRDKIRDLYDVTFITNNYYDQLTSGSKTIAQNTLAEKDVEQFDYLILTQDDPLIDKDKLETDFLTMWDKLGLLTPSIQPVNPSPTPPRTPRTPVKNAPPPPDPNGPGGPGGPKPPGG